MITNSFNANLDITHFIQSQRFCCHKLSNQTCVEQIISNMCFNSWSNWITSTFFTKHQDNIVHRYSIRNQAYDAFYPNLIIKVTFRWKMDVFNTLALKVQEPQGLKPRRKVGPPGHPFWFTVIISRNHIFEVFRPESRLSACEVRYFEEFFKINPFLNTPIDSK